MKPTTVSPTFFPTSSQSPTFSPTTSLPSVSPTQPLILVDTEIQIQMQNMTNVMSDYALELFEEICVEFLLDQFAGADPPIFGITCQVKNQQLLSQRKLSDATTRRLEGSQPLLVNVATTGKVHSTDDVTEASDVNYDDLVYGTFAVQGDYFVDALVESGEAAGIGDFEQLYEVNSIKQINEKEGISTPDDSTSGNLKKGAVALIAIGGAAMVLLFAGLIHQFQASGGRSDGGDGPRRKKKARRSADKVDDEEPDEQVEGFEPDPVYVKTLPGAPVMREQYAQEQYAKGVPMMSEDSINKNDNLTYAYSLEDGIMSPNSLSQASPANFGASPSSYGSSGVRRQRSTQQWTDGVPLRIRRDAVAPPGKLGIIIDTSSQGPIVHSVKPGSVLEGLLFEGDLIVAVDDEDTSEWSAHSLTRLMAKKSKFERKITVLSMEQ